MALFHFVSDVYSLQQEDLDLIALRWLGCVSFHCFRCGRRHGCSFSCCDDLWITETHRLFELIHLKLTLKVMVGRGTDDFQILSPVFQRAQDMPGFDPFYTFQALEKRQKHGRSSSPPLWVQITEVVQTCSPSFDGMIDVPVVHIHSTAPTTCQAITEAKVGRFGVDGAMQVGMAVKSPEVNSRHDFVWRTRK